MFPFFSEYGEVIYEELQRDLELGDIVLLRDSNSKEFIVHRVIDASNNTKGDFSLYVDHKGSVIGLVTGFIDPDLGIYHWGNKGHRFKGLFAYYAKATGMNKLIRYLALCEMIIWRKFYFSRKYKASPDYIESAQ